MAKTKSKDQQHDLEVTLPSNGAPLELTIKLIIKQESPAPLESLKTFSFAAQGEPADSDCPDNKFSYTIATTNATVLSLTVAGYTNNSPENSGDFTVCIYDDADKPKVQVLAMGRVDNPGGMATLMLSFLGKPMFTSPQPFKLLANGILMYNKLIALP